MRLTLSIVTFIVLTLTVSRSGFCQFPDPFNNPVPPAPETDTCQDLNYFGLTPQALVNAAGAAAVSGFGAVAIAIYDASWLEQKLCGWDGVAKAGVTQSELDELMDETSSAVNDLCDVMGGCEE